MNNGPTLHLKAAIGAATFDCSGDFIAIGNRFREWLATVADVLPNVPNGATAPDAAERILSRVNPDYPLRCNACGSPHWFDTSLPSDIWNQIAEPGDLLCLLCIDDRLHAKGLSAEAEFYFAGKALVGRSYEATEGMRAAFHRTAIEVAEILNHATAKAAVADPVPGRTA